MTAVTHDDYQPRTLPHHRAGKSSSWLGTCCGAMVLGSLILMYLPPVLPFVIASTLLCGVRRLGNRA